MNKLTQSLVSASRGKSERRRSRRCKFTQLMRICPSDPQRQHFDDMRGTQNPGSTNREYLAEVVRTDSLPNGLTGIGVKLLLETGPQHTYSLEPPRG